MTHVKNGKEKKRKKKKEKKEVRKIVTIKDGMKTHQVKITKIKNKEDCLENEKAMEGSIGMILGGSYLPLTEGTHENDDQDDIF